VDRRLRAVCDLLVPEVREYAGLHDYDGRLQDLSPAGVAAGLARLGGGDPPADAHDAAQLVAAEAGLRVSLGLVEDHRRNPLLHVANLDLSCYEREYAPAPERAAARRRHLAGWPDAVDAAVESLDRVPAPLARALLRAVRGLAGGLTEERDAAALAAHARLVAHVERAAAAGPPEAALGADRLRRLLSDAEALPAGRPLDLSRLAEQADTERDRLRRLLVDACDRLEPGRPAADLVSALLDDHPDTDEEIYAEARAQIAEATAFTVEHDLLPELGGVCLVGPAPPARQAAMAMMSWSAPCEPDAPSWYYVTPPPAELSPEDRRHWLQVFSRTTLPAITVHEVTPGHYAHGRMLRRLSSDVRRVLSGPAFLEGWAHYAEELLVEEGFRAGDPRYAIGAAVEALVRVTRLAVALGVHTGGMTVAEGARRFSADAFLHGAAAAAEAERATYDPTYGRYTWGKLAILDMRERARAAWGPGYTHRRFHEAMLGLGTPPLGLLDAALAG
jgi:hypothetical protein